MASNENFHLERLDVDLAWHQTSSLLQNFTPIVFLLIKPCLTSALRNNLFQDITSTHKQLHSVCPISIIGSFAIQGCYCSKSCPRARAIKSLECSEAFSPILRTKNIIILQPSQRFWEQCASVFIIRVCLYIYIWIFLWVIKDSTYKKPEEAIII